MELQLTLTLSTNSSMVSSNYEAKEEMAMMMNNKRSYDEAFDDDQEVNSSDVPQTLSLFVWKSNGEDDDDRDRSLENHPIHFNKNEEDENGVVGWPPIKSWRKRLCHLSSTKNYITVHNGGNGRRSNDNNSMYVKVKMDGVVIARKVDLSLHHSFQTLTHTLISMFGKCQKNVQAYKLTYQDRDGDWLLAGDVPWGTFLQSVQRLKLVKNED